MSTEEDKINIRKGINWTYYFPRTGYSVCTITYYPEIDKYWGLYTDENRNVIQYINREELEYHYRLLQAKCIPQPPVHGITINKIIEVVDPKCQTPLKDDPQIIEIHTLEWMDASGTISLCEVRYNPRKGYLGKFYLDGRSHIIKHAYDVERNWILMSEGCKPDLRVEEIKVVKTLYDLSAEELNERNITLIMDNEMDVLF